MQKKYTNGEITLQESDTYMRGLSKLNDLYVKGYQDEDPLSVSFEKSATDLANGDAVMTFSRTNIIGNNFKGCS